MGLHAAVGVASGPVGNATEEKIAPTGAMKILLSVAEPWMKDRGIGQAQQLQGKETFMPNPSTNS